MSAKLNESLENLRLRATCSICTELYTKPKQLPRCSHVFCLSCVKRYLQSKLPNNFPPCPMCRQPITRSLREVDSLEPARAEEDIIEFVRPFENCDLCKKRERPTLKCLQCSGLICDNCMPAHSKLQPLHTVVSIFESGVSPSQVMKSECRDHPNQTLDLFCLMCNKILCTHCEKYSHYSCIKNYERKNAYELKLENSPNLLRAFVFSKEEQSGFSVETRVALLKDFASFTRQRLQDLTKEVEKDVTFYSEYIKNLDYIAEEHPDESEMITQRHQHLKDEFSSTIEKGNKLILNTSLLIDRSTDAEIAESALTSEKSCLEFLRYRQLHSFEACCIGFATEKTVKGEAVLKQISNSVLKELKYGFVVLFVAPIIIRENTVIDGLSAGVVHNETSTEKVVDSNRIKCFTEVEEYGLLHDYMSDNTLHTNEFLDKAKPSMSHVVELRILTSGFTGNDIRYTVEGGCLKKIQPYDKKYPYIVVTKASGSETIMYKSYFLNFLSAAPLVYQNDNICRQVEAADLPDSEIICLIGSRSSSSGLEALFLEYKAGEGFTSGLSVCAKVVRFKQGKFINSISGSNYHFFTDDARSFVYLKVVPSNGNTLISYFSEIDESVQRERFFRILEDGSEAEVPISTSYAELLCELKTGMFIVTRENDTNKLTVARLTRLLKTYILFCIKQEDVSVPLEKLCPKTMAETSSGDIVVTCAVLDDVTKLILLLPLTQRVEILEIQYAITERSETVIVDLEMDSVGNIMYVLKNDKERMWSVITKYIKP